MQRKIFIAMVALTVLVVIIVSATTTHAQSGGAYELTWSTIDGGGATFSSGGAYELGGTIGQPDASSAISGGAYSLAGGFWANVTSVAASFYNYLPMILK